MVILRDNKTMSHDLRAERREYHGEHLSDSTMPSDPYEMFANWLGEAMTAAKRGQLREPSAMIISTVRIDADGGLMPRSRVVLLKEYSPQGLSFYTNYESDKGRELTANPVASALFWWPTQARQVRFEGVVTKVSREQSQEYFASRPRGSQLGAWASDQSRPVESLEALHQRFDALESEYVDRDVDCPPHWGGYLLTPRSIEFWQGQPSRLHDRIRYQRVGEGWRTTRLNP